MLNKIFALWQIISAAVKTAFSDPTANEMKRQAEIFENTDEINYAAIAAYNIASLSTSECSIEVIGTSNRAKALDKIADTLQNELSSIAYITLGEGGTVLVPQLDNGEITITYVSQKQLVPIRFNGNRLIDCEIILNYCKEKNEFLFLVARYTLESQTARISYRAVSQDGKEKPLPLQWQDKIPLAIRNAKAIPLVYCRSPRKGRKNEKMGVGIAYGCEETLESLKHNRKQIIEEIDSSRRILFVDEFMLSQNKRPVKDKDGKIKYQSYGNFRIKERIFPMKTSPSGNGRAIEDYSPTIRLDERIKNEERLKRSLESEIGLSGGIISELENRYVNVDEIRQQNSKTIAFISDVHKSLEQAIQELLEAVDMLMTAYALTPIGEWDYSVDWYDPFESSTTQFDRLLAGFDKGEIKPGEIRKWLFPSLTQEQVDKDIKEISDLQSNTADLLASFSEGVV